METKPSKFTLAKNASIEQLWDEIIERIPSGIRNKIDKKKSKLFEPYPGATEYILNDQNGECIAVANISEIKYEENDWSIYLEK